MTARALIAGVALAAVLAAAQGRADAPPAAKAAAPPIASQQRDVSLEEHRSHLQSLAAVVEACAKARDAATCDPALVGTDDRLPAAATTPAGAGGGAGSKRRLVSFEWLRALFAKVRSADKAAKPAAAATAKPDAKPDAKLAAKPSDKPATGAKQAPAEAPSGPPVRSPTELLQDATARLAGDLAQIDAAPAAPPAYTQERATMTQVLADPSFRNLEQPAAQESLLDRILKRISHWLGRLIDRIVDSISKVASRSVWIGRLIFWGFILAVCVGLVWGLMQLERGWRTRLVPEGAFSGSGAASARDWQLWLEDARKAAAAGQWRQAIHFLYWASISRLESRRLWPADRARTPREYLALVAPEDPRKAGLATLTGSFERIWYGGRAAAESDYHAAEQLAAALISASGARGGAAR
ncbi:MAG: DUF4129 domain-containing protein [Terracidiphilus sp.]